MVLKLTKRLQRNNDLVVQLRVKPEYIWYVNGIFEGYDGLGVVRTIDKSTGLLEILSTKDQEEDIRELLMHLREEEEAFVLG